MYLLAGNCPFCGAPIYQVTDPSAIEGESLAFELRHPTTAPRAHFTCVCRAKHGLLPVGDAGVEMPSVEEGDRKFIERRLRRGETVDGG